MKAPLIAALFALVACGGETAASTQPSDMCPATMVGGNTCAVEGAICKFECGGCMCTDAGRWLCGYIPCAYDQAP